MVVGYNIWVGQIRYNGSSVVLFTYYRKNWPFPCSILSSDSEDIINGVMRYDW